MEQGATPKNKKPQDGGGFEVEVQQTFLEKVPQFVQTQRDNIASKVIHLLDAYARQRKYNLFSEGDGTLWDVFHPEIEYMSGRWTVAYPEYLKHGSFTMKAVPALNVTGKRPGLMGERSFSICIYPSIVSRIYRMIIPEYCGSSLSSEREAKAHQAIWAFSLNHLQSIAVDLGIPLQGNPLASNLEDYVFTVPKDQLIQDDFSPLHEESGEQLALPLYERLLLPAETT